MEDSVAGINAFSVQKVPRALLLKKYRVFSKTQALSFFHAATGSYIEDGAFFSRYLETNIRAGFLACRPAANDPWLLALAQQAEQQQRCAARVGSKGAGARD